MPGGDPLRIGELEGQRGDEATRGRLVERHDWRAPYLAPALCHLGGDLEDEHLLKGEALLGAVQSRRRCRVVDLPHRLGAPHQLATGKKFAWQEFVELVGQPEHCLDLGSKPF